MQLHYVCRMLKPKAMACCVQVPPSVGFPALPGWAQLPGPAMMLLCGDLRGGIRARKHPAAAAVGLQRGPATLLQPRGPSTTTATQAGTQMQSPTRCPGGSP